MLIVFTDTASMASRPKILSVMKQGTSSVLLRWQTITGRAVVTSPEGAPRTSLGFFSLSWLKWQAMLLVVILAIHGLVRQRRLECGTVQ